VTRESGYVCDKDLRRNLGSWRMAGYSVRNPVQPGGLLCQPKVPIHRETRINGHRVTAVIDVAAKLGIADLLFEGPTTAAELSRLTDTHQRSLLRLMRGLAALAICTEATDGRFQLTEMGTRMGAESERSLKAWALFEGEMLRSVAWGGLIESIRTGKTANELAGRGQEWFERLAETKHAALFNEGMAAMTRRALPASPVRQKMAGRDRPHRPHCPRKR
jgi:hypothetical protein